MKKPDNENEIMRYIEERWNNVSPSDCLGYWDNMVVYLRRCFVREEIAD